jgi:NAD+ kinase
MYGNQILGRFRKAAIVVNAAKSGALSFAEELQFEFMRQGVKAEIFAEYPIAEGAFDRVDVIVSVGGDGTLLGVVAMAARLEIPIFAINHGEVGFLSAVDREHAPRRVENFKAGKFGLSERLLLSVSLGEAQHLALNDAVIRGRNCARLVKLAATFGNDLVAEYRADGVIVASPTGLTAYNFSAGGPIIHPNLDCMVLTPVCQYGIYSHSLVLPNSEPLVIGGKEGEFSVYCDGNSIGHGSEVSIRVFEKRLKLIEMEDLSFFDILRKKLRYF